MIDYATPADFAIWAERAAVATTASLLYVVADCRDAAEAMKGWNPVKEGYYLDQMSAYGMELTRRRRAAAK